MSHGRAAVPFLLRRLLHGTADFDAALVFAQPRDERPHALAGAPDPFRAAATPVLRARALTRQLGHELAEAVLDLLRPFEKDHTNSIFFQFCYTVFRPLSRDI